MKSNKLRLFFFATFFVLFSASGCTVRNKINPADYILLDEEVPSHWKTDHEIRAVIQHFDEDSGVFKSWPLKEENSFVARQYVYVYKSKSQADKIYEEFHDGLMVQNSKENIIQENTFSYDQPDKDAFKCTVVYDGALEDEYIGCVYLVQYSKVIIYFAYWPKSNLPQGQFEQDEFSQLIDLINKRAKSLEMP